MAERALAARPRLSIDDTHHLSIDDTPPLSIAARPRLSIAVAAHRVARGGTQIEGLAAERALAAHPRLLIDDTLHLSIDDTPPSVYSRPSPSVNSRRRSPCSSRRRPDRGAWWQSGPSASRRRLSIDDTPPPLSIAARPRLSIAAAAHRVARGGAQIEGLGGRAGFPPPAAVVVRGLLA